MQAKVIQTLYHFDLNNLRDSDQVLTQAWRDMMATFVTAVAEWSASALVDNFTFNRNSPMRPNQNFNIVLTEGNHVLFDEIEFQVALQMDAQTGEILLTVSDLNASDPAFTIHTWAKDFSLQPNAEKIRIVELLTEMFDDWFVYYLMDV